MHRVWIAFFQLKILLCAWPGSGIPSISTAYAQARRRCAQVIHMFVHRQQGSNPVAALAGSSGAAANPADSAIAERHLGPTSGRRRSSSLITRSGQPRYRSRLSLVQESYKQMN